MATTSSGAAGTGDIYHTLIELPLVSKHSKPLPEWENPTNGSCPKCASPVWMHKSIQTAMQEPKTMAMCTNCIAVERERQANA